MIRPLHIPGANRRRGTVLGFFVFLIPIAMMLLLTVLTRLDVARTETRRHHQRIQADLLAQSALAVAQAQLAAGVNQRTARILSGDVEGAGSYALRLEPDENGNWRIEARGVVHAGHYQMVSELEAVAGRSPDGSAAPTFTVHASTHRLEPAL